ncbi:hypothetical protein LOC67_00910 [Stieleria sp. JC731]|uniref:hypothetical protein n=1 Tax=Pirellulaceae TaxID=2691357 RepID=UPI001E3CA992|nr:hypothetical protein [Stieleria sp. JC731]MCC9599100.1 hypothetical protein [Stieleria sp. JC731]
MIRRPNELPDHDNRYIDTLLQEALAPDPAADERRIEALMQKIRSESEPSVELPSTHSRGARLLSRRNITRLTMAAAVMLIAGIAVSFSLGGNTAYATVMRAMRNVYPTRQYHVQMINRWPVIGDRDVAATLYISRDGEFCLQHPGWLPGGELWLGGDDQSRWFVPRMGPVITGDQLMVGSVLQPQGLNSPLLHMQTLLTRFSESYSLELADDERITRTNNTALTVLCHHVVGTIIKGDDNTSAVPLPVQIDLWANTETGVAERIIIRWSDNAGNYMPRRWQIDLVGYPDLDSEWFQHTAHSRSGQTVLPLSVKPLSITNEGASKANDTQ